MTKSDFQRARQPEQKQQRRADILGAARELLEEDGIDALSLNGLARRVGLAKSNLYRYFESREAVLLEVLRGDWTDWVDELEGSLGRIRGPRRIAKLSRLVASTCQKRPRMCQLMSVVSVVLEHNLSQETVRDFKLAALGDALRLVQALHRSVPELNLEQHLELLRLSYGLIAGLWPAANPPPVVREVLRDPALAPLHHEFEDDLERGVRLLALGLVAEGGAR